jgi:hypothetical protein
MKSPQIGVIIVYMSDCHSVRASKIILLHVFTFVRIIQMVSHATSKVHFSQLFVQVGVFAHASA